MRTGDAGMRVGQEVADLLGSRQHGEHAARLHVIAQAGGVLSVQVNAEETGLRGIVQVFSGYRSWVPF